MDLTVKDRGGGAELVFSRFPAARDQVAAWYAHGVLVDAGGAHTVGALEEWLRLEPTCISSRSPLPDGHGSEVVLSRARQQVVRPS